VPHPGSNQLDFGSDPNHDLDPRNPDPEFLMKFLEVWALLVPRNSCLDFGGDPNPGF